MKKRLNLRRLVSNAAARIPYYGRRLYERAIFTEIGGVSGHVSLIDEDIATERKLKPLNRFERWFMGPSIEAEKRRRQNIFRTACLEVMGEDPFVDDHDEWETRQRDLDREITQFV